LGDHRRVAGDEAGALAAFERAERLVTGAPPSAGHARVLARHARSLNMSLQYRKAIPYCEEAIAVARAVGARAEEARALTTLGLCLLDLGELDRSIDLHPEARRIAEQVGDAETIVRTYVSLTYALPLAGRDRDALDDARAGYQRARELGLERAAGSYVAGNLALSLLDTGRWAECERFTGELLAGDRWGTFALHEVRSALFTRRGDFAAAREHADLTLRLSPPYLEDWAWLRLAELALWEGRDDEAAKAVAEGLGWFAERDPTGPFSSGPASGTRLRCGWRPTGPSGQPPGGRPRNSPKPGS
jgi:tetratricopeptide (TPR) repeat protein